MVSEDNKIGRIETITPTVSTSTATTPANETTTRMAATATTAVQAGFHRLAIVIIAIHLGARHCHNSTSAKYN